MASLLESKPAFLAKAKEVGLSDELTQALVTRGIVCLAQFAFCTSYTLGSSDDLPLVQLVKTLKNDADGNMAEVSAIRRFSFEAQTLVTAEAKRRMESSEDDKPKRMPHVEREARLKDVEARLAGLNISDNEELEVSNSIVDLCAHVAEEGVLRYIAPELCTKRSQEMVGLKKDGRLSADTSITADLHDTLHLKNALQRRGLAMMVTFLMSYNVHDKWVEKLFRTMGREPLPNYQRISIQQILRADREWFIEIARSFRGGFRVDISGGSYVLDIEATAKLEASTVNYLLMPVPSSSSSGKAEVVVPGDERKKRDKVKSKYTEAKGKGKGKGKDKGKGGSTTMPAGLEGCKSHTKNGEPICWAHNLPGGCSRSVARGRCEKGLHVCCKPGCGNNHSYQTHQVAMQVS